MDEDDFDGLQQDEYGLLAQTCQECNSTSFVNFGGFYYCENCQTQSEHTQVFHDDESHAVQQRSTGTTAVTALSKDAGGTPSSKDAQNKDPLCSWEAYNIILQCIVDSLIDEGFPMTLKPMVFQLWSTFLIRRSVFLSEKTETKASQSTDPSPEASAKPLPKRTKMDKSINETKTQAAITRDATMSQKRAFEMTYIQNLNLSESDANNGILADETDSNGSEQGLTSSPETNTVQKKMRTMENEKARFDEADSDRTRFLDNGSFSLKTVIILIFIALRQIGCRLLFTDVIRLFYDGTLNVKSLEKIVTEMGLSAFLSADTFHGAITECYDLTSLGTSIENFMSFTRIGKFQFPQIQEFLPKFIDDSSLPAEFEGFVAGIGMHATSSEDLSNMYLGEERWKILVEILITSLMGVGLLLLFGLDDETETYQSKFASTFNEVISKFEESEDLSWSKLFSINEWIQHIRFRQSFLDHETFNGIDGFQESPISLAKCNELSKLPASTDDTSIPLIKLEPTEGEEDITAYNTHSEDEDENPRLRNELSMELQNIFSNAAVYTNGSPISDVPVYKSFPLPFRTSVETFKNSFPNVCYPIYNQDILYRDFRKRRIDFIHNPQKYIPFLEQAGYEVRILPGSAPDYDEISKMTKNKQLILFQPYMNSAELTEQISATLNFLVDHLSKYVCEDWVDEDGNAIVLGIMEKLIELYRFKSVEGLIPVNSL